MNQAQMLAMLRHAYHQCAAGVIGDPKQFADGLLAPVIRGLEGMTEGKQSHSSMIECYMCKIDAEVELPDAPDGARVFPTLESLRKHRPCVDDCGIRKVGVVLLDVIQHSVFASARSKNTDTERSGG